MRGWLVTTVAVSLVASAGETFPFDSHAIIKIARSYMHAHPGWENGLRLNYDEPHIFTLVDQSGRRFISVGFDAYGDIGDLGGSFVVIEDCPGGASVVALPGMISNFATYESYVTGFISDVIGLPQACPEKK